MQSQEIQRKEVSQVPNEVYQRRNEQIHRIAYIADMIPHGEYIESPPDSNQPNFRILIPLTWERYSEFIQIFFKTDKKIKDNEYEYIEEIPLTTPEVVSGFFWFKEKQKKIVKRHDEVFLELESEPTQYKFNYMVKSCNPLKILMQLNITMETGGNRNVLSIIMNMEEMSEKDQKRRDYLIERIYDALKGDYTFGI